MVVEVGMDVVVVVAVQVSQLVVEEEMEEMD
jgi:hypothetical protein